MNKSAASDEEIKQAFRTLAKRYHPDTSEGAADKGKRFKDLSSAYEILGDPIKRRAYDRGEIDGYGNPRAGYTPRAEREPERERAREYRSEGRRTKPLGEPSFQDEQQQRDGCVRRCDKKGRS